MTRGLKPATIQPGTSPLLKAPAPPAHLSREAKAEWKRVAPILVERAILTVADLGVLESYATAIGLMREASAQVQVGGIVLENGKRNPAVGVIATAQTQALRCAGELGLTPAARSRSGMIGLAPDDDTDNPLAVQ